MKCPRRVALISKNTHQLWARGGNKIACCFATCFHPKAFELELKKMSSRNVVERFNLNLAHPKILQLCLASGFDVTSNKTFSSPHTIGLFSWNPSFHPPKLLLRNYKLYFCVYLRSPFITQYPDYFQLSGHIYSHKWEWLFTSGFFFFQNMLTIFRKSVLSSKKSIFIPMKSGAFIVAKCLVSWEGT